eukprot:m.927442 g.927442  ORF g.927442 m.927442 type:complete len:187 (+) comp23775_c0_seq5:4619-5179(+)
MDILRLCLSCPWYERSRAGDNRQYMALAFRALAARAPLCVVIDAQVAGRLRGGLLCWVGPTYVFADVACAALDHASDDVQDKVAGLEQPSSRSDVVYRIRSLREEDADDATVHEVTLEQLRLVPRIGQADESTVLLLKEHKVGVSPPVGRLVHLACATRACPQCSVWAVLTEAVVSATYDSVYGEW